jgi:5,10-methylenetetrahydromethanopterin reductase
MSDQLPLRTSVGAGVRLGNSTTLDGLLDEVRQAEADGFDRVWLAHDPWSQDALTHVAIAGREVPRIKIGTAVTSTYPRHPAILAQQALTVDAAIGGRLMLGVGTSHKFVIEGFYGLSFDKPATHTREYLGTLLPLLADHALPKGDGRPMEVRLAVPGAGSPPVYLAALGPRMLAVAGELTRGTITWLTPAKVIREHIRPLLDGAAAAAGRPRPEVICGLPVCITDDASDARSRIAEHFKEYEYAPSYRASMDRAGAAGPSDVALVGTEKEVLAALEELAETGADELLAVEFGTESERARTRQFLLS